MPTPSVLKDDLLKPIRVDKPGGDDLRPTVDWIKIRETRPNPYDQGDKGIWTPKGSNDTGWPQLFEKTVSALRDKSKDLQLAIWLTEASTRLYGFAGMRDSLGLIREMLVQFWDAGLFPAVENGDLEVRSGPLEWLNDKLADLIRETPITARTDKGENYSYAYFLESRKSGGAITADQFDQAVRATPQSVYKTMLEDLQLAREEFLQLEAVAGQRFGPALLSFSTSKEALEECQGFLEQKGSQETGTSTAPGNAKAAGDGNAGLFGWNLKGGASEDSWAKAEQLVRSGRVSEALTDMTRLAATEPNGRVRFHRKLLLADICLSTRREHLAKSILEELAELIDKHHLEEWETPEVVGAVWSRLYKCYRNDQAGTADADRAAKLFLRLCRLDPWQALACNDGNN
jgi:type VI secretion system protein ImpA